MVDAPCSIAAQLAEALASSPADTKGVSATAIPLLRAYAEKYADSRHKRARHSDLLGGEEAKLKAIGWAKEQLADALPNGSTFEANEADVESCLWPARLIRVLLRERVGISSASSDDALEIYLKGALAMGSSYDKALITPKKLLLWWELLSCLINAGFADERALDALCKRGFQGVCMKHLKLPLPAYIVKPHVRFLLHLSVKRRERIPELIDAGILPLTVGILATLVRIESPPFPRGHTRLEATLDLLKLMFSIGSSFKADDVHQDPKYEPSLTQLGMLIVQVMLMSADTPGIHEVKLQLINIMLYMPKSFAIFSRYHGLMQPLMEVLEVQLYQLPAREGAAQNLRLYLFSMFSQRLSKLTRQLA